MSEDLIPFHLQNQPEIDQERINKKWYLQEDYLKPHPELQGKESMPKTLVLNLKTFTKLLIMEIHEYYEIYLQEEVV